MLYLGILAIVFVTIGVTMLAGICFVVLPMRREHEAERKRLIDRIAAVAGEQIHLRGQTALSSHRQTIRA